MLVAQKSSVLGVLDLAADFVLLTFFCFAVVFCVGDDKQNGRKTIEKQFVLLQVGYTLVTCCVHLFFCLPDYIICLLAIVCLFVCLFTFVCLYLFVCLYSVVCLYLCCLHLCCLHLFIRIYLFEFLCLNLFV